MKALRNSVNSKQVLVLDALRYSIEMERIAHSRLLRTLRSIERSRPGPVRELTGLSALTSAWQIIDTVHRARGLARQVRGLSQKHPEFQLFIRNTDSVEVLRNFFQHMNTSIGNISGKTFPIMGVVGWTGAAKAGAASPTMSYTLTIGHWTPDTSVSSMVIDTFKGTFVRTLELNAAADSVDLASIHAATRRMGVHLEKWLKGAQFLKESNTGASLFMLGLEQPEAAA